MIRQYRIRVVALDQSGFERTYITTSRIELINDLQCCSSYEYSISAFTIEYGPATPTRTTFKTLPDIVTSKHIVNKTLTAITSHNYDIIIIASYCNKNLDPVQGSVDVGDPETLSVIWETPQEIVDQGLTSYQLAVTAQCFTNEQPTQPMVFSIRPDEQTSGLRYTQQVGGLRK